MIYSLSLRRPAAVVHCCLAMLTLIFIGLLPSSAQAREIKTIGVVVSDLGNPFFEQIGRGVEDAAARLVGPDVQVIVKSSGFDIHRQLTQINSFISSHIDLMILSAVDSENVGPSVRRARDAGIVVVAIDVAAQNAQATVTSDNLDAGRLACAHLAKRLDGMGNVLIMNGAPTSSVIDRVDGCRSVLSQYPKLRILESGEDCGGTVEGGLAYMSAMLTKYPHIDAVFAINDMIAIGANIAATWSARSEFFITSVDGSPAGVDALRNPGTRIVASVAQHPRQMAEKAVSVGIELFAGRAEPDNIAKIPIELISRDNVETYPGWGQ